METSEEKKTYDEEVATSSEDREINKYEPGIGAAPVPIAGENLLVRKLQGRHMQMIAIGEDQIPFSNKSLSD